MMVGFPSAQVFLFKARSFDWAKEMILNEIKNEIWSADTLEKLDSIKNTPREDIGIFSWGSRQDVAHGSMIFESDKKTRVEIYIPVQGDLQFLNCYPSSMHGSKEDDFGEVLYNKIVFVENLDQKKVDQKLGMIMNNLQILLNEIKLFNVEVKDFIRKNLDQKRFNLEQDLAALKALGLNRA